jgi:hypothetical protein
VVSRHSVNTGDGVELTIRSFSRVAERVLSGWVCVCVCAARKVMGSLAIQHDAAYVSESLLPSTPLCPVSPDLPWAGATPDDVAAAHAHAAAAHAAQQVRRGTHTTHT